MSLGNYKHISALDTESTILSGGWWKNRHPKLLPELPPELWIKVFEHATYVHGAYETGVPDPFEHPEDFVSLRSVRDGLYAALLTKRYIVRVCKAWNTLGTPILYRAILIRKVRVIPSLVATMSQSKQLNATDDVEHLDKSIFSVGRYTQRLDFNIGTSLGLDDVDDSENCFAQGASLIRCLSQLEIFTVTCKNWLGPDRGLGASLSMVAALREHCSQSLRVLIWTSQALITHAQAWADLASFCPQLCVLKHENSWHEPTILYPNCIRRLKSCSSFTALGDISSVSFSDTEVHLPTSSNMGHGLQPLTAFVRRLIMTVNGTTTTWESQVSTAFPQLQQIIMTFELWSPSLLLDRQPLKLPQSVTHCGIVVVRKLVSPSLFPGLLEWMGRLEGPALQVFRLMDDRTAQRFLKHASGSLPGWVRSFRSAGIRLEGPDGNELLPSDAKSTIHSAI